jgi:hypothetical protein
MKKRGDDTFEKYSSTTKSTGKKKPTRKVEGAVHVEHPCKTT